MMLSRFPCVRFEPFISIDEWSIREVKYNHSSLVERRIIGFVPRDNIARVSSAIYFFNDDEMTITTRSGRFYSLLGYASENAALEAVWKKWCDTNGVKSEVDVSHEYSIFLHVDIVR